MHLMAPGRESARDFVGPGVAYHGGGAKKLLEVNDTHWAKLTHLPALLSADVTLA